MWAGLGYLALLAFLCAVLLGLFFVVLLGFERLFYLLFWTESRPKGLARVAVLASLGLVLSAVNWFVMMSVLSHVGGTGYNGKIVGTHYYVGNHGRYTEVSREVYWFTNAYFTASGLASAISFAVVFLCGFLIDRKGGGVPELRQRNDIGALYELIEMLDLVGPGAPRQLPHRALCGA